MLQLRRNDSYKEQLIPMVYKNYNDGIPFYARSARVYLAREGSTAEQAFRLYPASEASADILFRMFMSFRVENGSYSDLPFMEYSSSTNSWNTFAVCEPYSDCFAPSILPRSTATDLGNIPYYAERFELSPYAAITTKHDNISLWTISFTPVSGNYITYRIFPYAILLISNPNGVPSVMPRVWNVLDFNSPTSHITINNVASWDNLYGNEIPSDQISVISTGQFTVQGVNRYYKVVLVKTWVQTSPEIAYHFMANMNEVSIPLLSFTGQVNGDEVAFLELGCDYGKPNAYQH